jgi:hypothetical protein
VGYVREQHEGDVEYVADRLRRDDLREVQAASGLDARTALRSCVSSSGLVCTVVGQNPCALFGVVPIDEISGSVWLLGTDELTASPLRKEFLRKGRQYVDALHNYRPLLGGYIDEHNEVHVRWLKKLGFSFINRHPHFGFEKRPFLEFVRLRA